MSSSSPSHLFNLRREVQLDSEPILELPYRRTRRPHGTLRAPDYSNDGTCYNNRMFELCQIGQHNITDEAVEETSVISPGAYLHPGRPVHTEYNYYMRSKEANVSKPPNTCVLSAGRSPETYTDVQQGRQTSYLSDFGPFQKNYNQKVASGNTLRFPAKPPQHVWRSSAPYNYQNIGASTQQRDYWQYSGPRYDASQQVYSSQTGRIRVRDMNSINRIAPAQPVSAGLQRQFSHVNRYDPRLDILGQKINTVNYPSSRFDGNHFRPLLQKPPTAPRPSMFQNRYYNVYTKPREQVLQGDQYQMRNIRPSEPSQENNSDPLVRDLLGFLTQTKEVPQNMHTMDRSNIPSMTAKDNNLSLSDILQGGNSVQHQNRSSFDFIRTSQSTKHTLVPPKNLETSQPIKHTLNPPKNLETSQPIKHTLNPPKNLETSQPIKHTLIPPKNQETSQSAMVASENQEMLKSTMVASGNQERSESPKVIPKIQERCSSVIETVTPPKDENVEPFEKHEQSNIKVTAVISLPLLCGKLLMNTPVLPFAEKYDVTSETQKKKNEDSAQHLAPDNNLPIDPWKIKKEPEEPQESRKLEEQNCVNDIDIQSVKKENFQRQDDENEPQNMSKETCPTPENFIIENEIKMEENQMSVVEESQKENFTIKMERQNLPTEDQPGTREFRIELTDKNYKSNINRSKLDMLIEFLKEGKWGSDNLEQNHTAQAKVEEKLSLPVKIRRNKDAMKAIPNEETTTEMVKPSFEDSRTVKTDESEKKTKSRRDEQNPLHKKQSKRTESAEKTNNVEENREKRKPYKKVPENRSPIEKGKSCESRKGQLDTDESPEKLPEAENSMQGEGDSLKKSKSEEKEDSSQQRSSTTANKTQKEVNFPIYFSSKYEFCEYCLTARSMPEFWMNIATGQIMCVFCLNGTSRYAELQRQRLKILEEKKRRNSPGSFNREGSASDDLSAREKILQESEDKNQPIKIRIEKEKIKSKKRKSLDDNEFPEKMKKEKCSKSSKEHASKSPGNSEPPKTEKTLKIILSRINEVRDKRLGKYSRDRIKKSKDETPSCVQKRTSSTDDIWHSKKQILEKVDCTDKHKKSLEILESIKQLEKEEESQNQGDKEKRQEVKRRVSWKEQEGTKESPNSMKKTPELYTPVASSPAISSFDRFSPDVSMKDNKGKTKRKRKLSDR